MKLYRFIQKADQKVRKRLYTPKMGKVITIILLILLIATTQNVVAEEMATLHFYAHSDGTPLEGVTYVATNTATGQTYTNTTDHTGWTTLHVPIGEYTVEAHSEHGTETRTLTITEAGEEYNYQSAFDGSRAIRITAMLCLLIIAVFIVLVLFIMWFTRVAQETFVKLSNSEAAKKERGKKTDSTIEVEGAGTPKTGGIFAGKYRGGGEQ